jgi:hypothetical protein
MEVKATQEEVSITDDIFPFLFLLKYFLKERKNISL